MFRTGLHLEFQVDSYYGLNPTPQFGEIGTDQYIMNGQKKQSLNCGLSGRASGGPLFIHLSIYPISVPVDMCN